MLDSSKKYSRSNNIVFEIETQVEVLKLKQTFPDVVLLPQQSIDYLNRYCDRFPELCEFITPKIEYQTKLF